MTKSAKHPVRSLLINALLMAVAFGALGLGDLEQPGPDS